MTTETQVRPFREIIGGKIRLHLHEGQTAVDDSKARYIFMLGSPQVGKTCYGPHWLNKEIRRCGSGDYLAVTATYDLFKLKMLPELLKTFDCGEALNEKGKYISYSVNIGRYWTGMRLMELAEDLIPGKFWAKKESDNMWGRIILRSAEAKGGLVSTTAKAAWIDEPGTRDFSREAWDNTKDRVALAQGRILGTATIYLINWIKSEIYIPWSKGDKSIDVIQVDSLKNPVFPRSEYEAAKRSMPEWMFDMKYRGIYQTPAGLIYDCFRFDNHVIAPFEIPLDWPRYCGHDFGVKNTATLWYAQNPNNGELFLYREYWRGGISTFEHVSNWIELSKGERIARRVGGAQTEEGWRGDFSQAGWRIEKPVIKDVEGGIQKVYGLHKLGKLFVFNTCLSYLDEKQSYSRELDDNYEPTEKIENKDKYHLMDAERYILSEFASAPVVKSKAGQVWRW